MNYNIIGYLIYLLITAFITIQVGWICYKNGAEYLKDIFITQSEVVEPLNKLLLIGYYLMNLGYAAISINNWEVIPNFLALINLVSSKIGWIVLILAAMHYFNMFITAFVGKRMKIN